MAGELSGATVQDAAERLRGVVVRTPLLPFQGDGGKDIWIKPEVLQPIGSFKLRGAYNAIAQMMDEERPPSAFTISTGNMSQAVAWSASYFGIPSKAIMPEGAPELKIAATRSFGAEVEFVPRHDLFVAMEDGRYEGTPGFVHPFRDARVSSGNGTIGLEILEDLQDVESVFAPLGGGGLVTGIAMAVKSVNPDVRVYGVEPEGCCAMARSLRSGKLEPMECDTIVDSAGSPFVLEETISKIRELVDDVLTVPDDLTMAAIRTLALRHKLVVEGAGALAVAAALRTPSDQRGKTVCIVSGGSIDPRLFAEIVTAG